MTPAATPSLRRSLTKALAIATILLLVAHTATWYVVTGQIADAIPGVIAAAGQDGWRIATGAPHRAGWPTRADIRLDGIAATREFGATSLRWTAETLDLAITPTAPGTLVATPSGPQSLSSGGAPPLAIDATAITVRIPLIPAASDASMTADTTGLSLRWPNGPTLSVANARAQWDGLALTLAATGLTPTPAMAPPFNGPADLAVRIVATAPFPQAPSPAQSAALWQHANGQAQLREFTLHLAALSADGSGEGGLDSQLQPEARATLRVTGAAQVLDAAAAAGLVAPGPASAVRAVLGLLTLAAHGGPVAIPIELAGPILTVARFPVLRFPELDWGGP